MEENTYIISTNRYLEATLSLLFVKHRVFCDAFAGDCEILAHKKQSRTNILNWTKEKQWPNNNTNDFLNYEIHQEPIEIFLTKQNKLSSESFIYIDARKHFKNIKKHEALSFGQVVMQLTECNVMIVLPGTSSDISLFEPWLKSHLTILDTFKKSFVTVLTNYDCAKSDFFYIGQDRTDRQRIKRKQERLIANFSDLPEVEKRLILTAFISQYMNSDN